MVSLQFIPTIVSLVWEWDKCDLLCRNREQVAIEKRLILHLGKKKEVFGWHYIEKN